MVLGVSAICLFGSFSMERLESTVLMELAVSVTIVAGEELVILGSKVSAAAIILMVSECSEPLDWRFSRSLLTDCAPVEIFRVGVASATSSTGNLNSSCKIEKNCEKYRNGYFVQFETYTFKLHVIVQHFKVDFFIHCLLEVSRFAAVC